MKKTSVVVTVFASVFYTGGNSVIAQGGISDALSTQNKQVESSRSSQTKINRLSRQTREMLDEYKLTLHKIDNLKAYNAHLGKLIKSQKEESIKVTRQLGEIDDTQQNISPFIIRMINTLGDFVKLDTPFHKSERLSRISSLNEMINRADISVSEKFRRTMEAYQIEVGYGKTLSSYQGKVKLNDKDTTVDFLRIGRVGFYYRTLDNDDYSYWDINAKSWKELPGEFHGFINKAFKVARKHEAPDLLMTPVQFTRVAP